LDINNAVGTMHPKALKKKIASVIFACRLVAGTTDRTSLNFFSTATSWVNQGFVAYC
jgi:hypothetical protein